MSAPSVTTEHPIMISFIFFVILLLNQTRPVDSFTRPCNASLQTVQRVSECPINRSSYEKAVKRKNCSAQASTVKCHSFQYHCVLSDKMDYLVEVCAASLNVIGHVCARYSTQYKSIIRVDGLNCTDTNGTNVCPFSYNSTNGYQYSPCYTFVSGEQQPTKDQSQRSDAGGSGADAVVAVIVILLIICIIIVVLVLYKRNQFGLKDKMQPYIAVIAGVFRNDETQQANTVTNQQDKKGNNEDSEQKSLLKANTVTNQQDKEGNNENSEQESLLKENTVTNQQDKGGNNEDSEQESLLKANTVTNQQDKKGNNEDSEQKSHLNESQEKTSEETEIDERVASSDFVAAIDFGTAYSGYAFSTLNDYNADPLNISTLPWNEKAESYKIPTNILFDADKKFIAFGNHAEEMYSILQKEKCYFFRKFKMLLYDMDCTKNERLTKQTLLRDINGKEMLAIDVFSAAVKYLKDHVLQELERKEIKIQNKSSIKWVLTVPGIWDDLAKQFMRDAAEMAGIGDKELVIALEPEVASFFCSRLPKDKMKICNERSFHKFQQGTQYLIMDAGGGTVDICVHRIQNDGQIEEVIMGTGGAWGGTYIDRKFLQMFESIIGKEEFNAYKTKYPSDYFNICKSLELGKRNFSSLSTRFVIDIPLSLDNECKLVRNSGLNDLLKMSEFQKFVKYDDNKLYLSLPLVEDLFRHVCSHFVKHIENIFNTTEKYETKMETIIMVGGFSESPYLQETIMSAFPDYEIMIPHDAWLSVLKGAVLYGHYPKAISSRIAKCSYGVDALVSFDPNVHSPERCKTVNGAKYCNGFFSKHVTIHDELKADAKLDQKTYRPVNLSDKTTQFDIYTSTKEDSKYIDEADCKRLASITVKCPTNTNRITLCFTSVETELKVDIFDEETGNNIEGSLDYFTTITGNKHPITLDKNV